MHPPKIFLYIGLPGSGKTTLAKKQCDDLEKSHTVLFVDDLFVKLRDNQFDWNKVFTTSQLDNIIITDFLACQPSQQKILFQKLQDIFPQAEQHWIFFNNEIEQCRNNIQQRNNGLNVDITLANMSREYKITSFIQENATSICSQPVYQALNKKNKR